MPPPPLFIIPGSVQRRPGGRIAGTNYANAIRDLVYRTMPIASVGNADRPAHPIPYFFSAIQSWTMDGSNFRWKYTIQEVTKSSTGYGGWTTIGSVLTPLAYNTTEDQNGSSGVLGNGVDTANLPAGFSPQPVPIDTIVLAWAVVANGDTTEYWFTHTTVPDGTCDEDAARTADVADDSELLAMIGF